MKPQPSTAPAWFIRAGFAILGVAATLMMLGLLGFAERIRPGVWDRIIGFALDAMIATVAIILCIFIITAGVGFVGAEALQHSSRRNRRVE